MISQYKWYKRKNIKARHINSIVITYMKHIGASEWTFNAANLVYAWSGPRVSDIGKAVRHSLRRKELHWFRCEMHAYHNQSEHLVIWIMNLIISSLHRYLCFISANAMGRSVLPRPICWHSRFVALWDWPRSDIRHIHLYITMYISCIGIVNANSNSSTLCFCNSKCQLKLEAAES